MKTILQLIIILFLTNSCVNPNWNNESNTIEETLNTTRSIKENEEYFKLSYIHVALGSGMGNKESRFKIKENNFLFTRQQNSSWNGSFSKTIDTICQGKIRLSSIDSIKIITNQIEQPEIYETNPDVMSGGIDNIVISFGEKKIDFTLHNASHPKAKEIFKIINSNIPSECGKLSLWK